MTQTIDTDPQPTWQAPQPPPTGRPWYKKKWVWAVAVVAIIGIGSAGASSSKKTTTQNGALHANLDTGSTVTTAAQVAPTTTTAPAPTTTTTTKVNTCDNVREALLTGTQSQIDAAMAALQADKSADATAREYADYYLHRDGAGSDTKDLRDMDVSLIRTSCSLG